MAAIDRWTPALAPMPPSTISLAQPGSSPATAALTSHFLCGVVKSADTEQFMSLISRPWPARMWSAGERCKSADQDAALSRLDGRCLVHQLSSILICISSHSWAVAYLSAPQV